MEVELKNRINVSFPDALPSSTSGAVDSMSSASLYALMACFVLPTMRKCRPSSA